MELMELYYFISFLIIFGVLLRVSCLTMVIPNRNHLFFNHLRLISDLFDIGNFVAKVKLRLVSPLLDFKLRS